MNVVKCSQCQALLNVPEAALGREICCPKCMAVFNSAQDVRLASQESHAPLHFSENTQISEATWRLRATVDGPRQRWRTVHIGLGWIFISLFVLASAAVLTLLTTILFLFDVTTLGFPVLMLSCFFCLAAAGSALGCLFGLCFCLASPRSRNWALGFAGAMVGCFLLLGATLFTGFAAVPGETIFLFASLVLTSGLACFTQFLRETAQEFGNASLARECLFLLALQVVCWMVVLSMTSLSKFVPVAGMIQVSVLMWLLGPLPYLLWLTATVQKVRNTIRESLQ